MGSIGAAVAALRGHVPNPFVPILGGQPSIGRYCAFSTLFARAGAAGAVSRLDRHPTMSVHPVTPMHEADLRLHLHAQGCGPVAGIHLPAYAEPGGIEAALRAAQDAAAVLFDVTSADQLALIGDAVWHRAVAQPLLAVGPSSVAQALTACWGLVAALEAPPLRPADRPVLVLAGSLSPVTRRQVEAATSFVHVAVEADRLVDDPIYPNTLAGHIRANLAGGRHVLAYTAAGGAPADTTRADRVATATARLLPMVLARMPVRRVGIAGGDTSSQAAQALGLWGLSHAAPLGPGVAVCTAHSDDPRLDGMELMLKGGQMGDEAVFERLVAGRA